MPVSPDYRDYILEQLNRLTPTTARSMFGGAGLYSGGRIFGLLDDDTLYFKVNDETRGAFEAAGCAPFRPFGEDAKPMKYYEVPADAVEDQEALRPWLDRALLASRPAGRKKVAEERRAAAARNRGTLRVNATVTIDTPLPRLFDAWASVGIRRLWLHVASVTTRRQNARKSIRLNWNDGSSNALAEFTAQTGGRCVVTVVHEGIRTPAEAAEIAEIWNASLKRLKTRMER